MRILYRSENNSSKEPQVGVMRSDLNELNISPACAVLQPGVRTSEYSCLRQTWTQDWIASTRFRPLLLSLSNYVVCLIQSRIYLYFPLYDTYFMHHMAMLSEELLAFLFCYYMQTSTGLCVRCVESMLIPVAKLQTDTTLPLWLRLMSNPFSWTKFSIKNILTSNMLK